MRRRRFFASSLEAHEFICNENGIPLGTPYQTNLNNWNYEKLPFERLPNWAKGRQHVAIKYL